MSFSLLPCYKFISVTNITPQFLTSHGFKLLLLDLDNTLAPYKTLDPDPKIAAWLQGMRQGGIDVCMVSNNKGIRPEVFAKTFDIPFIKRAGKPGTRGINEAISKFGVSKAETALVGDQIYTDMIAAGIAGITGILVKPIKFTNPFLAIRYFLELPFRIPTGKNRECKEKKR